MSPTLRLRPGLGSIRLRLTLLVFAVTVAASAVVYFYVAPPLESSLRRQKIHNLEVSARAALPLIERTIGTRVDRAGVQSAVLDVADRTGAHVTLLGVSTSTTGILAYAIADSAPQGAPQPNRTPMAMRAASSGRAVSGSLATPDGDTAVVALPLDYRGHVARVAIFSQSLSDIVSDISVIRHRILVADLIAFAIAMCSCLGVARALSRRVRRLESAARSVAAGDFSARFEVDSPDELGQLAAALDDMQRQLQELDSARKRFIATASHELRTPIFSLGGFLELIQDEELDDETRRQFVGQVRQQVDRLGKLAADLLDLSKLEAGAVELTPEPTDLGVLARAVTAEFIPALNVHDSRLQLRVVKEPLRTTCDPERVAQILRILVDNAVTHTAAGTAIEVTVERSAGNRGAAVTVVDHGAGIPPGREEQIFEPFYTSDGVQGSGLGLAIAKELAERMHARLQVESRAGRTAFTLTL